MADIERLQQALIAADQAGDTQAAQSFAQEIRKNQIPSQTSTFLRGVGQGASFNLSDEVMSGVGAGLDFVRGKEFGESFDQRQDEFQQKLKLDEENNPVAFYGGQIAGGLGTGIAGGLTKGGLALGSFLAKGGRAAQAAKGAAVGSGVGAVSGFGGGSNGVSERLGEAGASAITGSVGGALAPSIQKGIGIGLSKIADGVKGGTAKVVDTFAQNLVKKKAVELNIINDLEPDAALDKVLARLQKDYPDPKKFEEAISETMLEEKALINIGKNQTVSLADAAATFPAGKNVASDFLNEKALNAPDKMKQVLSDTISNKTNFTDALDNMVKVGRQRASGIYKKAFETNTAMKSPRINQVLKTPAGLTALKEAVKNIQNDIATGTTFDDVANSELLLKKAMKNIDDLAQNDNTNVEFSLQLLDQVKKGFDDNINLAIRNDPSEARRLIGLKKAMVAEVDTLDKAGLYQKARRTSGDYLSNKAAMEDGISFLKDDAEQVVNRFGKYGQAEKESYQVGVVKSLRDQIEKTADGRNVSTFFNKESNRKKLRAILTPEQFKTLAKEANATDNLFKLKNRILGGSQTAERLAAQEEFGSEALNIVKDVSTTGVTPAAINVFSRFVKRKFTGLSDKKAGEVAEILFTENPVKKEVLVKELLDKAKASPAGLKQIGTENVAMTQMKAFFDFADKIRAVKLSDKFKEPLKNSVTAQAASGSVTDQYDDNSSVPIRTSLNVEASQQQPQQQQPRTQQPKKDINMSDTKDSASYLENIIKRPLNRGDLYVSNQLGKENAGRLLLKMQRGKGDDPAFKTFRNLAKTKKDLFFDGKSPRSFQEVYNQLINEI